MQDKHLGVEFQSEIQTLAKVDHLNLVRFYGYVEQEDERIVVVEYVPNGSLRQHLDCKFSSVITSPVKKTICQRFLLIYILGHDQLLYNINQKTKKEIAGMHGKVLDLATRLDIVTDVAHAVTYLHMYTGFCPVPFALLSSVHEKCEFTESVFVGFCCRPSYNSSGYKVFQHSPH